MTMWEAAVWRRLWRRTQAGGIIQWWRRGESNPRPKIIHLSIYILSPIIEFRSAVPNRAISPQN